MRPKYKFKNNCNFQKHKHVRAEENNALLENNDGDANDDVKDDYPGVNEVISGCQ